LGFGVEDAFGVDAGAWDADARADPVAVAFGDGEP